MAVNLQMLGDNCLMRIKRASWFPYKTGKLKFHATSGSLVDPYTYKIHFSGTIAPYIEYLEKGTQPSFRISKNGNMFYHSGSGKHVGFISNKCVHSIVNYIAARYKGTVDVK